MNKNIFQTISTILSGRRPTWQFIIEDELIRVSTMQFAVDWPIFDEIIDAGDYEIVEVITHSQLGVVVCIRYTGEK